MKLVLTEDCFLTYILEILLQTMKVYNVTF